MACQERGVDVTVGVGVGVAEECWGRRGEAGGEGEAWGRALPRRPAPWVGGPGWLARARQGPTVATVGRARGGPAGVADEPVMKPGAWAPFVSGKPFKKPLPQPPCGASGDKGRRRRGPSGTPPFRSAFPVLGRQEAPCSSGSRAARGARAALRG